MMYKIGGPGETPFLGKEVCAAEANSMQSCKKPGEKSVHEKNNESLK
jgi:hypothetical protein